MNILTFDIEDWFHILNNDSTRWPHQWSSFESRLEINFNLIMNLLDENNTKATFFVLGWIAEKYPSIIKHIDRRGFQIGSHTYSHQLIYNQSKNDFYNDVEKSIKILEDLSGKKVTMFRAPGFSIKDSNIWAFEILYDLGIRIDSSIFPAHREHGGYSDFNLRVPAMINYHGKEIKEFPINNYKFFNHPFVFSGGGFFRILPYSIINFMTKKSPYVMSYFHPRDFDYNQPNLKGLSKLKSFKANVGLKSCYKKLNRWISAYDFIDINAADKLTDWKNIKPTYL